MKQSLPLKFQDVGFGDSQCLGCLLKGVVIRHRYWSPRSSSIGRRRVCICEYLQMAVKFFLPCETVSICCSMSLTPTSWLLKISLATLSSCDRVGSETV